MCGKCVCVGLYSYFCNIYAISAEQSCLAVDIPASCTIGQVSPYADQAQAIVPPVLVRAVAEQGQSN